ncbi:urate hydroxylase PuuD [Pseudenhygromyxa sp. WMMC2535]|uniref:urate hydroxylase PuuD n=1 Tax=Pseudenhygromyxa sp. WMMC2535 TaxID=2712867 RepID=UPI0015540AAB|nr:urate hydroxylase PuuD [Pseudenhygromyxa sp. WMMC2535]NVB40069.1 urate hydroxylase PuuD [Pseudenhygromyxa sp. WMMC2535]
MGTYLLDWLELIVRWAHLVFGAAWIGTSFYFNWLNHALREPERPDQVSAGVGGEVWSIHGGHFYRVLKYEVAPERLPKTLHWFKWEAYMTWISGALLLTLVYYLGADQFLIDAGVRALSPGVAVGIGAGSLVVGWLVYDLACRSPLGRHTLAFAAIGFLVMTGVAYGLTQTFGSRAAYIHVGAMLGTMMAANVFVVIIPNQRKTVGAMVEGGEPDPKWNRDAAQRSLHNNYLTLPVLFIMVSNHYPFTYGNQWNWALLAAIALVGAGTRHWFNLKDEGKQNVWILPAAALAMVALAFVSKPKSYADYRTVGFEEVRTIVGQRCVTCHSAAPTHGGYKAAPQGVMFDKPEQIATLAPRINSVVVVAKTMPLANQTGMTEEEREIIAAWIAQGADVMAVAEVSR